MQVSEHGSTVMRAIIRPAEILNLLNWTLSTSEVCSTEKEKEYFLLDTSMQDWSYFSAREMLLQIYPAVVFVFH